MGTVKQYLYKCDILVQHYEVQYCSSTLFYSAGAINTVRLCGAINAASVL
jgi:hypothetical protein